MKRSLSLCLYIFLGVSSYVHAQKTDPYGFSAALSSGGGIVEEFITHPTLGLRGTYHRQYGRSFSLRTSLWLQYFLPGTQIQQNISPTGTEFISIKEEYLSGSLLFGPYAHFRDKGYRLHWGLQLGAGFGWEAYRRGTDPDGDFGEREYRTFTILQTLSSMGVLFPLGDKSAELGLEVAYLVNWDFDTIERGEIFQRGHSIALVYHYNFRK